MAISAGKFAPSAVVLAMTAYCVWPTASSLMWPPESKPPENVAEMPVALFSPAMPPPPMRNPFPVAELAGRPQKVAGKAIPRTKAAMAAAEAARRSAAAKALGAAAAGAKKALLGLTLQGTSIMGDDRLAMIDNRLYAIGDKVALPGTASPRAAKRPAARRSAGAAPPPDAPPPPAPSYEVVAVLPDKVLLKFQGLTLELTYSDTRLAPPGKGVGKPAAKGKKPGKGKSSSKKRK